jgi:gliding motility-associated-like protein
MLLKYNCGSNTLNQKNLKKLFLLFIIVITTNLFSVQNLFADDYYWVAGSGNWSELNHWATSSGGSVFHSSVPDFDDNVIFDQHSFNNASNTVTIDVENAVCLNLSLAGINQNLIFAGSSELHIHAGLTLSPLVDFQFSGSIIFKASNTSQQLVTENKTFSCDINFTGLYCNWTVLGDLICEKSVYVNTHFSSFSFNQVQVDEDFALSANSTSTTFNSNITVGKDFYLLGTGSSATINGSLQSNNTYVYDGTLNLGGNFSANQELYLSNGEFNSNGHNLTFTNCLLTSDCAADISNSTIQISNRFTISGSSSNLTSTNTSLYFSGGTNLLFSAEAAVVFHTINFSNNGTISCSNSTVQSLLFANNGIINGNSNNFGTVTFQKNGQLNGNNQFNNLTLTADYEYLFQAGNTQTITGNLNASGNCQAHIILKSDLEGTQANIAKASGTSQIDYAITEDINFTGGAAFLSSGYVNIKNTTGLTGSQLANRTLYWTGGNGNWSDAANWSLTSGGTGGECIPSPSDHVVFDANSFPATSQQVLIDAEQVFCNTMDWTAATNHPTFANTYNNATLHVFGSYLLSQNMDNNFDGKIFFRSESTGNEIQSNNNSINADIYFEGENGAWTLIDDLQVIGKSILLNKGTFNSAGQEINTQNLFSKNVDYTRSLNIENSEIYIQNAWEVVNERFSFTSANSHIYIEKVNATMQAGTNLTYNNISFTNAGSTSATINGNQLTINQLYFAADGAINCSESTIQNMVFDGEGTLKAPDNLFVNAVFNSHGFLLFNNAFDVLNLTAGNNYTFKNGVTQTINTNLVANGDCNAPINLRSDVDGSLSSIEKLNSDLVVDYVIMKDIAAVAGVNYTANNTTDLGNNPGWIINAVASNNYYWVGGTGDWEDPAHWSFTSGGSGGAAGACLPSQNDNVYFDALSFTGNGQAVNVNIEKIACKNMDWSQIDDQVNFNNTVASEFDCFGSMFLSPGLNWNYNGNVSFKGNNNIFQINTEGNPLLKNATFVGENAEWEILSDFSANNQIEIMQGTVTCNNQTINAAAFLSGSSSPAVFTANNTTINIANSWASSQDFTYTGVDSKINLSNYAASFSNTSINAIAFNEIALNNQKTTLLSNNSTIKKLIVEEGSINGSNTSVDSLFFTDNAQITGNLAIGYGKLDAETQIFMNHQFGQMNFYGPAEFYSENTFETANFYHDAIIYGNNTYDSLVFSADHAYSLGAYHTQTVNNFIQLEGNNCFKIILKSTSSGGAAIISMPSGTVKGYAVSLSDIHATGGASFYAAGPSADLGRNDGWIFGNPPGYIYGFSADSIYLEGETATLTTSTFNTNANTQYTWSTGSNASSITTTVPGKYTVEVVYNAVPKQCSFTDEINIHFVTIKDADCGANGEIIIQSDPSESYDYLWSNGDTDASNTALFAGEYSVEVTNTASGEKAQRTFTLIGPPELDAVFTINNQTSCIGTSDGQLGADISGGTPPYTQFWMDDTNITSLTRNNLSAGVYRLNIADKDNCQNIIVEATVTEPEKMEMEITPLKNISCFGDNNASLTYAANGGTPPYTCEWNNGAYSNELHYLSAGEYAIMVTDANECEQLHDTIVIEQPEELYAHYNLQNPQYWDSNDGSIEVTPDGGTPAYSYYFTNIDGERLTATDALAEGEYILHLTDNNQCQLTDTVLLVADYEAKLIIPNTFTPNNDNQNDYFVIKSLSPLAFYSISIHNRWGQKLFESNNINNSWDGRYKGRICSPGVYYYLIQYQNQDKIETRKGFLQLFN